MFVVDHSTPLDIQQGRILTGPNEELIAAVVGPASVDDFWFTPTVACVGEDNKKPTLTEQKACRPFLTEQIEILQPSVVVAMGAQALKALDSRVSFTSNFGRTIDVPIVGEVIEYTVPVFITYSLNGLIRNPDMSVGGLWYRFFAHISAVLELNNTVKELSREFGEYERVQEGAGDQQAAGEDQEQHQ